MRCDRKERHVLKIRKYSNCETATDTEFQSFEETVHLKRSSFVGRTTTVTTTVHVELCTSIQRIGVNNVRRVFLEETNHSTLPF